MSCLERIGLTWQRLKEEGGKSVCYRMLTDSWSSRLVRITRSNIIPLFIKEQLNSLSWMEQSPMVDRQPSVGGLNVFTFRRKVRCDPQTGDELGRILALNRTVDI